MRRGLTLIELLVVIFIIGLLVAILLPAVQAARESARRMQCQNNLRQLGIASHSHHDTAGYLPGSEYWWWSFQARHSPAVLLLPYVEQNPLYQKFDLQMEVYGTANSLNIVFDVPLLYCPSDRHGLRIDLASQVILGQDLPLRASPP